MLYDACPACAAPIQLPLLLEKTPAGRIGHASLRRCARCCHNLADQQAQEFARASVQAFSRRELAFIKNGRPILAALYKQYFKAQDLWHSAQGLSSLYGPLVDFGRRSIDRKLAAWRSTREFLAEHPAVGLTGLPEISALFSHLDPPTSIKP